MQYMTLRITIATGKVELAVGGLPETPRNGYGYSRSNISYKGQGTCWKKIEKIDQIMEYMSLRVPIARGKVENDVAGYSQTPRIG